MFQTEMIVFSPSGDETPAKCLPSGEMLTEVRAGRLAHSADVGGLG
ncbi:hypothetical protein [Caulobacter sp. BE254]|nr:hypothetical protein [Caulobacter sp. BE254]MDR7115696.1 hypothetical protein [Caulobacter sp. BE254]